MADKSLGPIFNSPLDDIKEPTYDDVRNFIDTMLTKAPHHIIIEEFENLAEYVVTLEKILDEHEIDFSDDVIYSKKMGSLKEIEDQKRLFLLHFAGKVVRKEGSVV